MYKHKEGITLRKVHKGDLHSLLDLKNESWWGTHGTPILNAEDQLKWYETLGHGAIAMMAEAVIEPEQPKGGGFLGSKVQMNNQNCPIGVAIFSDIDWFGRTLNLSGSVFKPHRKNWEGVVKPAFSCGLDFCFEVLNMQRVGAEVLETHAAAQKLEIGHLGFKVEGRRRRAVWKAGKYYDSILLGILKEEWEDTPRVSNHLNSKTGCCNDQFDHTLAVRGIELSKKWITPPERLNGVFD